MAFFGIYIFFKNLTEVSIHHILLKFIGGKLIFDLLLVSSESMTHITGMHLGLRERND